MVKMLSIAAALAAVSALAGFLWMPSGSDQAIALPESAQAEFYDITVTTSSGQEISLPDKIVTCTLVFTVSSEEGVYDCPPPYDIEALLAEPQVSLDPLASGAVVIEIDAATIFSGLPANSWQTGEIEYGATLSSANVVIGEELTGGESGHIENSSWPDVSRGVHPTYFYYRAKTNSSGYMGTEWFVRGTQ